MRSSWHHNAAKTLQAARRRQIVRRDVALLKELRESERKRVLLEVRRRSFNGRNNESYSKLLELVLKDELGNGSRPSASPGLVSEDGRLRLAPLPAGLPPELPARTFSYPDMRNTNSRRARTVPSASPRGAVPLTTADGDAPTRALDGDSPRESAARWLERTQM